MLDVLSGGLLAIMSSSSNAAARRIAATPQVVRSFPSSCHRSSLANQASDSSAGLSRQLFCAGRRPLHSLRRLKELEQEDACLATPQSTSPQSPVKRASACALEASEVPAARNEEASDSEDDTLEVVRSMKDLQRMRGGPRKGLDVRADLDDTADPKEEEEVEDAGGLLEKNFASGGPGSAADRHL